MIYLDTSVAFAEIMSEPRRPPPSFWNQEIGSSQLLRYEIWNRLHVYDAGPYRHEKARDVLRAIDLFAMSDDVLLRALTRFPVPVRTLDGLHLATMGHLRGHGATVELASYDVRLIAAAQAMEFPILQA